MAEQNEIEEGILLSQAEMDNILADVRSISKKQTEDIPEVELSQGEIDALFSGSKVAISKPFERPKQINVITGHAKWTRKDIERFNKGESLLLDTPADNTVEVLADGHLLGKGILTYEGSRCFVKIIKFEN
jgi:flagellar motor switch/type III secretory pathway protein FliN